MSLSGCREGEEQKKSSHQCTVPGRGRSHLSKLHKRRQYGKIISSVGVKFGGWQINGAEQILEMQDFCTIFAGLENHAVT
jgi:hypothetical protein